MKARVRKKIQTRVMFTLRCVMCKSVDKRPGALCTGQPYCKECNMPMTLEKVSYEQG
jgi:hypothetical protein